MPTTKLGLPTIAGNASADVVRDLNALATAIDDKAGANNGLATLGPDGKVPSEQLNVQAPADASTTVKGIVMLEDSTSSISVTKAATPKSVKDVADGVDAHKAETASLTTKGHVQLNSSVTSTSEAFAATPKAVKTAMDRADAAFQSASNGKIAVANAITAKGVTASPSDTFPALANKISQIYIGKKWASGVITPQGSFPHAFSVTGLGFKPTVIVLEAGGARKLYMENSLNPALNTYSYTTSGALATSGFTTTNDGFSSENFSTGQITWRAYE